MENELVYDLNVFDLIQRDERWQKVWDYFVASCYPKSDLKPRIDIDEFRRVKHGSPNRWRDNWVEFKKKVTRCELLDHLDRTKSRRHWNVSDGKLSRSTNLDENLYLSMTVLGEILGENLQQQRRGNFHYPHMGYREWHTNRYDPWGWRLYLVHTNPSGCGSFRFQEPVSHRQFDKERQIHTRVDHDGAIRLFRVQGGEDALWHSICSEGGDRFSLGFIISNESAQHMLDLYRESRPGLNSDNNYATF